MYWVSYARAAADMASWAMREPVLRDAAAIIGVPRSGLLLANILALHLNKHLLPLSWLNTCADSVPELRRGRRRLGRGHVVVVDDSVLSGRTMLQVQQRIAGTPGAARVRYAAAYMREEALARLGDSVIYGYMIPRYAAFAWNWAHQRRLEQAVLDIDGVLYPQTGDIDMHDAPSDAPPLVLPTFAPLAYATGRREKWRAPTQRWLDAWKLPRAPLYMMPTDKAEHGNVGGVIGHKAHVAVKLGAQWFVESEPEQAAGISELAKLPVLCTGDWRLYAEGRARGQP